MGYMTALDLADVTDIANGVRVHLQSNHYPPVHIDFVEPAIRAINAVNAGDLDEEIVLPNGLTRTAAFIVDGLHLHAWLTDDEDY